MAEKYLDAVGTANLWNRIKSVFVAKETGKGLSDNNFSTAEKSKLAGVETGANNYSLPTASASVKGGVKVGANLSIDGSGVLSATTQSIGRYIVAVSYEYGGAEAPFDNPTVSASAAAAIPSHINNGEDVVLKFTAQGVPEVYYARFWGHNGYGIYCFQLWNDTGLYDVYITASSGSVMILRKM